MRHQNQLQLQIKSQTKRPRWVLVALFFLLASLILFVGYGFYRFEADSIRTSKIDTIRAIADLQQSQIMAWR